MLRGMMLLLGCFCIAVVSGQTLISEMGPVMYYNSLDSAQSVRLNHIARRCYCLLQRSDTSHAIHLKLDLDTTTGNRYYLLLYNSADSSATGKIEREPGLFIKSRDSTIQETKILLLLYDGIRHYGNLQRRREAGLPVDTTNIIRILGQQPSPALKRLLQYCK